MKILQNIFLKNEFKEAYAKMNKSVVPHFTELDYVFGLPILSYLDLIGSKMHPYNYTEEEFNLSLTMMTYWTNFAKNGYFYSEKFSLILSKLLFMLFIY